ncbi:hypothetical protein CHUAL_009192 [Chamberlinius hualienensis]
MQCVFPAGSCFNDVDILHSTAVISFQKHEMFNVVSIKTSCFILYILPAVLNRCSLGTLIVHQQRFQR